MALAYPLTDIRHKQTVSRQKIRHLLEFCFCRPAMADKPKGRFVADHAWRRNSALLTEIYQQGSD